DVFGKLVGKVEEIDYNPYSKPISVDKEGSLYLFLDTTWIGASEWRLEVYKYSKEGKLLARVKLSIDELDFTDRYGGQKDRIAIDRDGNIYQLLPKENGVYVYKWEVKK
ncbi:MAG: hypothetical protein AB1630_13020, partial [bacterium]